MGEKTKEFDNLPEANVPKKRGRPKSKKNKLRDAFDFLDQHYQFRYNKFTERVDYKARNAEKWIYLDQRNKDLLWMELKLDANIPITRQDFDAMAEGPLAIEFNPVLEYIFSLPQWDGKDRFPEFLQQVQLRNEEARRHFIKAFTKWFVAYVAGLVDDFTINENCLVLAGPQGIYKTTFLSRLVPQDLRLLYVFIGNFISRDKDHQEYIGTKMLINLDEMATLNRNDIESIKADMSKPYVVLRRAYGRGNIHLYRRASFCGSINYDEFLTDTTGNRRWLPFAVENITLDNEFDIGLLYAQALAMFKNGFQYYFDRQEIQELERFNEEFRRVTMEEELLLVNYAKFDKNEPTHSIRVKYMTTSDIANELASMDTYRKINVNDTMLKRLGQALHKLGFVQRRKRTEKYKNPVRVWEVVRLTEDEADALRKGEEENEINYGLPI